MSLNRRQQFAVACLAVVTTALVCAVLQPRPLGAWADGPGRAQRYSVVDSDGTNLIVTDNDSNMLYFYAIDRDAQVGADLKLRGTVDLNQTGKPVLKPKVEP